MIRIELEVGHALVALGAIQDKALDASRLAAIATGEEREIADLTWKLLSHVEKQITDALYPPEPTMADLRRDMLSAEVEFGMI